MSSGQIIATSHDLTPNGGLVREIPLFQGNLGWWNIIIWQDVMLSWVVIGILADPIFWTHNMKLEVLFFCLCLVKPPCFQKRLHVRLGILGGWASECAYSKCVCWSNGSGQIVATSAEVTPDGSLVWKFPKNPLNSGLGIITICPDGCARW